MNLIACHFFMTLNIVRSDIPSIDNINKEFKTFVENLVLKHFNVSNYIGVFHDNKGIREINLPEILGSHNLTVLVHDLMTVEVDYNFSKILVPGIVMKPTECNIIIIEDSKNLRSMLKVAKSIQFFSAKTNTLVILTGRVPGTEKWLRQLFSQLWEIYILNIGLVFYTDKVNVYTYIPWTSPHEILDLTSQGISANIFFDKLKNLHNYPIKILKPNSNVKAIPTNVNNDTIYIGIDGKTMSLFLERRNATSKMIEFEPAILSPCRFIHYNYTIQGMFGADEQNESIDFCSYSLKLPKTWKKPSELDIINHDADISFQSRPLTFNIDYRVDIGSFQQMDSYCLMIPAIGRIPQAFNLLMPYEPKMWITILLNFIVHVAIYFGIQTLTKTNEKGLLHTCILLCRIQLANVVPSSRELRNRGRAYLMIWILYSFIISAAYQSVIMSFLTVPVYFSPINRIKELKEMDFSIYVTVDALADMQNALDDDYEASEILLPKVLLDLWTDERKYDPRNGYLVQQSTARYLLQRKDLADDNGRPFFHLMNECPIPLLTSYQMQRGSPFRHAVNKLAYLKSEFGFAQIWHNHAIHYLNSQIPVRNVSVKRYSLTTLELQGAFYILLIGNALGLCAFLLELYWKWTKGFIQL